MANLPSNPWIHLPTVAPYVLQDDLPLIDAFNRTAIRTQYIDTSLLPEPFLGRPDAPVVLLGLNPGWSPHDALWHANPDFAKVSRGNLAHASSRYPFYLLNPAHSSPGYRWWARRLRPLIERLGLDAVATGLLCVEYFPYHSDKYGSRSPRLLSQDYGFALVRSALARRAAVVVLRSSKRWFQAIPELGDYDRRFALRSVQNVTISRRNCPDGFDEIIQAIENGR